jgi:uncharacterized membrane protein YcaP (DUF421 family)
MEKWIIVLIRTISLFFLTLIITRIIGKGSLSKATPFKLVSYMTISIVSALIVLGLVKNIAFGFLALGTWTIFFLALDYLSLKSKMLHDLINGKETVLIKAGKVMEENLMKARLTGEELLRELRNKNAFSLADVEFAVMEVTGDINVMLKSDKKPITPHDMQRKVSPAAEAQTVILDGNILDEHLSDLELNREWLNVKLSSIGVSIHNVFIGQVDSSGDLYLDLFDDLLEVAQPKVKELLYANLSKIQADFLSFALETENSKAKEMYSKNADKMKKIMDQLEPYLLR